VLHTQTRDGCGCNLNPALALFPPKICAQGSWLLGAFDCPEGRHEAAESNSDFSSCLMMEGRGSGIVKGRGGA
jgi:hypothetical protein